MKRKDDGTWWKKTTRKNIKQVNLWISLIEEISKISKKFLFTAVFNKTTFRCKKTKGKKNKIFDFSGQNILDFCVTDFKPIFNEFLQICLYPLSHLGLEGMITGSKIDCSCHPFCYLFLIFKRRDCHVFVTMHYLNFLFWNDDLEFIRNPLVLTKLRIEFTENRPLLGVKHQNLVRFLKSWECGNYDSKSF